MKIEFSDLVKCIKSLSDRITVLEEIREEEIKHYKQLFELNKELDKYENTINDKVKYLKENFSSNNPTINININISSDSDYEQLAKEIFNQVNNALRKLGHKI